MKAIGLLQSFLLASQMFLISSQNTELPDEPNPKWDIDFNDMLEFEKSFRGHGIENKKNDEFLENQLDMINNYLTVVKKLDLLEDQAKQYIKRYINLFLVKCNLQDVPELDQDMKVDLEFSITKQDLLFLQSLSKDISKLSVHDNLRRLDSIFDGGLHQKVESLYETSWSFMHSLMKSISIPPSLYYSKIFYYVVVLTVTLLLLIVFRLNNISNAAIVLVIINNLIILEGVLDYLNELKQAEIEDNVMLLRAQGINPDVCDPGKQSYWSKIVELFMEDECLKYHKTFVKSKVKEMSPLKYILDAYNVYLFQYPGRIIGACIRVFSENLFDSHSWILKNLLMCTSFIFIIPLIAILIFCLMKPSIRFSMFGACLNIGFNNQNNQDLYQLRYKSEAIEDRRIQEIQDRESRDVTPTTAKENGHAIKGEESVESCSKLAKKSGNVEDVAENWEPQRTLLDDVKTVREIVNDMKNE